jgi:hypothetical protein
MQRRVLCVVAIVIAATLLGLAGFTRAPLAAANATSSVVAP